MSEFHSDDPQIEAAIAARAASCDCGEASLQADLDLLQEQGFALAPLPVKDGGRGWACEPGAVEELFAALHMLGRANLSVARIFEGHINAVKLILLYGTSAQIERLAETVRDGSWLGVWGADGSPPVRLEDGRLSGVKRFASGLGLIAQAVIVVNGQDGPRLLIAPCMEQTRADATSWRVGGMRATLSGTYDFADARAEPLGATGDYAREPWFEGGIWRYCAAHLGGAEALRDAMAAHLITDHKLDDVHQRKRVAAVAMACETARLWILGAAHRVESSEGSADGATAYALLAREMTERCCVDIMRIVDRAVGTAGHASGSHIERVRRDLGLFLRQADLDGKLDRAASALVRCGGEAEAL